jgi:hypothetical protein
VTKELQTALKKKKIAMNNGRDNKGIIDMQKYTKDEINKEKKRRFQEKLLMV